jgi:hypothetical protein
MRRLTRLTLAFSKKRENFEAAVALHFAYYNFVKRHNTLRCTPAMAAAALILATCRTDKPPELATQSFPRFALQNGQTNEIGLTGRITGTESTFLAMPHSLRQQEGFQTGEKSLWISN